MQRSIAFVLLLVFGLPAPAAAQDARQILETARQKQLERWEGVDIYRVDQTIMGNRSQSWFQRAIVTDDSGKTQTLFMPISGRQAIPGQCQGAVQMTPEALDAYAAGLDTTGSALGEEYERGMDQAGLPRGLLQVGGGTPGTSMDPRVSMGGMADFARAAADAERMRADESASSASDARESANHLAQFMNTARLLGTETVDGRAAFHLRSEDIDQVQEMEDGEYRMQTMSLWMDKDEYVPLKMKIDGTMHAEGQSRPITIESMQSDYRQVPGSRMYEPYRRITSISGMMTPEQEREMQEAQAQMQEFEKEMASMPPDQRRMMENMMGPRLEMMRNMVSGGGFRSEITVNEIAVNPVMTGADGEPCPAGGAEPTGDARPAPPPAPQAAGASGSADNLNVMVQEHLQTLGYYSGEAHGNLDTATIVAISRFQSENDMDVTGEVTPQLAGILAARASRGNAAAAQAAAAPDPAALQRAQEACLQEKIEKAQASQKKKRGFGRLLSGVSRAATQFGGSGIATDLSRTTSDLYAANATAEDLSAAASDLGLTEDDIEACRNPM